jgi:hypothetical protein
MLEGCRLKKKIDSSMNIKAVYNDLNIALLLCNDSSVHFKWLIPFWESFTDNFEGTYSWNWMPKTK